MVIGALLDNVESKNSKTGTRLELLPGSHTAPRLEVLLRLKVNFPLIKNTDAIRIRTILFIFNEVTAGFTERLNKGSGFQRVVLGVRVDELFGIKQDRIKDLFHTDLATGDRRIERHEREENQSQCNVGITAENISMVRDVARKGDTARIIKAESSQLNSDVFRFVIVKPPRHHHRRRDPLLQSSALPCSLISRSIMFFTFCWNCLAEKNSVHCIVAGSDFLVSRTPSH